MDVPSEISHTWCAHFSRLSWSHLDPDPTFPRPSPLGRGGSPLASSSASSAALSRSICPWIVLSGATSLDWGSPVAFSLERSEVSSVVSGDPCRRRCLSGSSGLSAELVSSLSDPWEGAMSVPRSSPEESNVTATSAPFPLRFGVATRRALRDEALGHRALNDLFLAGVVERRLGRV
jgi:hypothetical protein